MRLYTQIFDGVRLIFILFVLSMFFVSLSRSLCICAYTAINLCTLMYTYRTLAKRLECSLMARETWVQSQVESYQRLKKWYLMPPCLTLSILRYGSRVKWSNPGKGVAPFPTPWCSKLSKREPSGHPRLWSPTLLTLCIRTYVSFKSTGVLMCVRMHLTPYVD